MRGLRIAPYGISTGTLKKRWRELVWLATKSRRNRRCFPSYCLLLTFVANIIFNLNDSRRHAKASDYGFSTVTLKKRWRVFVG